MNHVFNKKMKNILYTIILSFLFSSSVFGEDRMTLFDITKQAAEQGDANAQYRLAWMYDDGKEAIKWYRLAAEQGHARAQATLGDMYFWAIDVTQDYKEAEKWNRLAAENGSSKGQFNLGWSYRFGSGVSKNLTLSYMWLNVAVSNQGSIYIDEPNWGTAALTRNIIEKKMTSEQIADAQELARECIKKNYKDCG